MNGPQQRLLFDKVSKYFGGTAALEGVSFSVGRSEVVALLGENGAGKSTLIKILGGIHRPDAGSVSIDGAAYVHRAGSGGQAVAFVHQDLGLIEWMTVAENMALSEGFAGSRGLFGWGIDWKAAEDNARSALSLVACAIDPQCRVHELTRTEKSLVAIARALASKCQFLILDEPTASLPADEVSRLFDAILALRRQGVGIVYVSHRLDEVFRIADRAIVLRDGQLAGIKAVADTNTDELIRLIVGRQTRRVTKPTIAVSTTMLDVQSLKTAGAGPVSFQLKRGEVLGLVGLRGAGHEQVGRALFGVEEHTGLVRLEGRDVQLASPSAAVAAGIGLIARDRTDESVALAMSITENLFLNPAASGRRLFQLEWPADERRRAVTLGDGVSLRPNLPDLPVGALSGGNQQKVVVARWLATGRRLLIAEDPTAGVDVGAKSEIYALINTALAEGLGVIVISTDFEEVAGICHRALVFSRGVVVDEISDTRLTTENIVLAASASEVADPKGSAHAVDSVYRH